jgi:hypothetical protein
LWTGFRTVYRGFILTPLALKTIWPAALDLGVLYCQKTPTARWYSSSKMGRRVVGVSSTAQQQLSYAAGVEKSTFRHDISRPDTWA